MMLKCHKWQATIIGILVLLAGCVQTSQTTKPLSPEEIEIRKVLTEWEKGWNNKDLKALAALIHPDARIMYGREKKLATKPEWFDYAKDRIKSIGKVRVSSVKTEIKGDKATARYTWTIPQWQGTIIAKLVKENGQWLFTGFDY